MAPESRPVAVVTGGSSGIGLELSRLLANDRHDLYSSPSMPGGLRRSREASRRSTGVRVVELAMDLGDPEAPRHIESALRSEGLTPDVVVNNAGFGLRGPFVELDLGQQLRMIQVNVHALTHLTGLLLPGMVGRRRGRVLNVASMAAFQPGPLMAVYYATKAYVLSFSEALANETRGTGVTVTALCPGPTATAFEKRAGLEGTQLFRSAVMDAAAVARYGYDAMRRGVPVAIPGWRNRVLAQTVRFVPRALAARVVRSLQERRTG